MLLVYVMKGVNRRQLIMFNWIQLFFLIYLYFLFFCLCILSTYQPSYFVCALFSSSNWSCWMSESGVIHLTGMSNTQRFFCLPFYLSFWSVLMCKKKQFPGLQISRGNSCTFYNTSFYFFTRVPFIESSLSDDSNEWSHNRIYWDFLA